MGWNVSFDKKSFCKRFHILLQPRSSHSPMDLMPYLRVAWRWRLLLQTIGAGLCMM